MNTELNNKTDRAWEKLRARLDAENLIPKKKNASESGRKVYVRYAIIGTAAILLTIILIGIFYQQDNSGKGLILAVNNDKSSLVKTLEDGSIIYLTESSSISYPEHFSSSKREVTLDGEAFFKVSKNKDKPFIVNTQQATIVVIGTSFNVSFRDNEPFSLSVIEGKVMVTGKHDNRNVFVSAGETVLLKNSKLEVVTLQNKSIFDRYRTNIRFKDEYLINIVNVISLSDEQLTINVTPELRNRKMTVAFSNDSAEEMVNLICRALNAEYTRENNVISIN